MSLDLTEWAIKIIVLLFAVTVHEYAHGKAALSLGDPTAKNAGRLTLNPISHIDPIGAICLVIFHFGWAKPVPVNIRYFQDPKRDTILMALSGPIANISAAFVAGLFLRYFYIPWKIYLTFLGYMIIMNTGLGLFNLIPIPPLDGSHVLENILPQYAQEKYRQIKRYAPFILIGILLADRFLQTGIISRLLSDLIFYISYLFGGENFLRILKF